MAISSSVAFLFVSYSDRYDSEVFPTGLLGFFGAGSVLGVAFGRVTVAPIITFLGTSSYSIYLIHYFFISIAKKILIALAPSALGVIALLILVAFSTLTGCLYFFFLSVGLRFGAEKLTAFLGVQSRHQVDRI